MRRVNHYNIDKESIEDMIQAKRFNPCLEITFWNRFARYTHKLSVGYGDELDVYREGFETYVLSRNHSLGYVGLEVFEKEAKTGEIFLEGHQVKETIGRDNLAPYTIIRRLRRHIV